MNLMDNAADASVENGYHKIKMVVDCDDNNTVIEIIDYGKGLAKDGTDSLGSKIQDSDKANGLGWGMFLSNVSIERIGGSTDIEARHDGTSFQVRQTHRSNTTATRLNVKFVTIN